MLLWTELTEIGMGTSSAIAKLASLGLAYFHRLEGFLPAGGEVADPLLVQYFAAGLGLDPGFPTMHEPSAIVLMHTHRRYRSLLLQLWHHWCLNGLQIRPFLPWYGKLLHKYE